MNVLALCTGNSARSILLEAILNRLGQGRVTAFSAGSHPVGHVHPQTLRQLERAGLSTAGLRSKNWDEFAAPDAPPMDAVITVCSAAAGETCPIWPGAPVRAHWGRDDPAAQIESNWETAFARAFDTLHGYAETFLALPFESMDRATLTGELNRIGEPL